MLLFALTFVNLNIDTNPTVNPVDNTSIIPDATGENESNITPELKTDIKEEFASIFIFASFLLIFIISCWMIKRLLTKIRSWRHLGKHANIDLSFLSSIQSNRAPPL